MAATQTPVTRQQTDIWLTGQPQEYLPTNVLPTLGQTLQTFFYHRRLLNITIPESLNAAAVELLAVWNRARIPTEFQPNIVSKLKGSVEEYSLIRKTKADNLPDRRVLNRHFLKRRHYFLYHP